MYGLVKIATAPPWAVAKKAKKPNLPPPPQSRMERMNHIETPPTSRGEKHKSVPEPGTREGRLAKVPETREEKNKPLFGKSVKTGLAGIALGATGGAAIAKEKDKK